MNFEPALVEEAVFQAVRCREEEGDGHFRSSFDEERSRLYEEADPARREAAFASLYARLFSELGFRAVFERALGSFPLIQCASISALVRRVWRTNDEGAELFVAPGAKTAATKTSAAVRRSLWRTVAVSVRTGRFSDLPRLESFLRHELMHVSDMLDPQFGYVPDRFPEDSDHLHRERMRERFSLLWDLYVTARLGADGRDAYRTVESIRSEFEHTFRGLGDGRKDRLFSRVTGGAHTQEELLAWAEGRQS